MTDETVRADWIVDQVFLLRDRNDFPIVMSQRNGASGADLLPLSLIGCAAWDIEAILRKQRQEVTRLSVVACSEREPDPPWRFKKIRIVYQISGRNLQEKAIERAIMLTETRYCSIFATLRDVVEIESRYEIVPE